MLASDSLLEDRDHLDFLIKAFREEGHGGEKERGMLGGRGRVREREGEREREREKGRKREG